MGYVATAKSIAAGSGATNFDGAPLVSQPPLYPAVLAVGMGLTGGNAAIVSRVINAFLFGLAIFLSGLLFFGSIRRSRGIALIWTAGVVVAIPLTHVASLALSELLFIDCLLISMLLQRIYFATGKVSTLLLWSISIAAACLTRYIGVTLIAAGVICILWHRGPMAVKLTSLAIFTLSASLPLILWLIRNVVLSETVCGPRTTTSLTLHQNLSYAFDSIMSWYLPMGLVQYLSIPLVLLCAFLLILVYCAARDRTRARSTVGELFPPLVLITMYLGFLLATATTVAYDQIGHRLLSPMCVPITLIVAMLVDFVAVVLANSSPVHYSRPLVLAVAAVLSLSYPTASTIASVKTSIDEGRGLNSRRWLENRTIEYLRRQGLSARELYSNIPELIYIHTGRSAKVAPQRTWYKSTEGGQALTKLVGSWPKQNGSFLIWFRGTTNTHLFTPEELETAAKLSLVASFEDGAIYAVDRKVDS